MGFKKSIDISHFDMAPAVVLYMTPHSQNLSMWIGICAHAPAAVYSEQIKSTMFTKTIKETALTCT